MSTIYRPTLLTRSYPLFNCVFSCILLIGLTACNSNKTDAIIITQLDTLIEDSNHACKEALLTVGSDLILDKNHFLTLSTAPNPTIAETTEDSPQVSISQAPLIASGTLEYKDRPAHVYFTATEIAIDGNIDATSACLVSYKLDYHFDEPCISIRENAFKKWNQLDSFNTVKTHTRYFQHMRKPNKTAFLTDLDRNSQCLVSVNERQTIIIANDKIQDTQKQNNE